jgi:hypothetical protein
MQGCEETSAILLKNSVFMRYETKTLSGVVDTSFPECILNELLLTKSCGTSCARENAINSEGLLLSVF